MSDIEAVILGIPPRKVVIVEYADGPHEVYYYPWPPAPRKIGQRIYQPPEVERPP